MTEREQEGEPSMIQGVDVYSGYGPINWSNAKAADVRFALIKCGEGNEPAKNDHRFDENVTAARAAGVAIGAYFFGYPLPSGPHLPLGRDAGEQAKRFFQISGGLGAQDGELPPALDLEWPAPGDWDKWGCSSQQISDWGRAFCETAMGLWGRRPLIYTYPWFWKSVVASADVSWAKEYPLWLASYVHSGPGLPSDVEANVTLAPWDAWSILQYSADGSHEQVAGISAVPVDRDCIRDDATLAALTKHP
jgi:GH25 family lysozyme M1 (1,4-beta-N-acetylmuramidase)